MQFQTFIRLSKDYWGKICGKKMFKCDFFLASAVMLLHMTKFI